MKLLSLQFINCALEQLDLNQQLLQHHCITSSQSSIIAKLFTTACATEVTHQQTNALVAQQYTSTTYIYVVDMTLIIRTQRLLNDKLDKDKCASYTIYKCLTQTCTQNVCIMSAVRISSNTLLYVL